MGNHVPIFQIAEQISSNLSALFGLQTNVAGSYRLTPDSRFTLESSIIKALEDIIINSSSDPEVVEISRRSLFVIQGFHILWDPCSISRKDSSEHSIKHHAAVALLRWITNLDDTLDPCNLYEGAMKTILETERKMLSLQVLKNLTKTEIPNELARNTISTAITSLFLTGHWAYVISIVDKCFNGCDEAATLFVATIKSHFPESMYNYDSLHHQNHPMYEGAKLNKFKLDLYCNMNEGSCLVSEDHILLPLFELVLNGNPFQGQGVADDETDTFEDGGEPSMVSSLFKNPIVQFFVDYVWFRPAFEQKLNDSNPGSMDAVFRLWADRYLPEQHLLSLDVVTCVLLLNNDLAALLACMTTNAVHFVPLLPVLMSLLFVCVLSIPISTARFVLRACAIHVSNMFSEIEWNEADESRITRLFLPYEATIEKISTLIPDDELTQEELFPSEISSIWEYIVFKSLIRSFPPSKRYPFVAHLTSQLLELVVEGQRATVGSIYIMSEINTCVNTAIMTLKEASMGLPITSLGVPSLNADNVEACKSVVDSLSEWIDYWLTGLTMDEESAFVNRVATNPSLLRRLLIQKDTVAIYKPLMKLTTLAMLEVHRMNKTDPITNVLALYCFTMITHNIISDSLDQNDLWKILNEICDYVSLSRGDASLLCSMYTKLVKHLPIASSMRSTIMTLLLRMEHNSILGEPEYTLAYGDGATIMQQFPLIYNYVSS